VDDVVTYCAFDTLSVLRRAYVFVMVLGDSRHMFADRA
jgi:hypothetical protein